MSFLDFFTNEDKSSSEVDVEAPAFSATKVQAAIGVVIAGILGAVPPSLEASEPVVIAAIAAGTAVILGVFGLVGVDIRTRQKAREAALRYGGEKTKAASFNALPVEELVLQKGHNADEYEVKLAMVDEDRVSLVASRDGKTILTDFAAAPKHK